MTRTRSGVRQTSGEQVVIDGEGIAVLLHIVREQPDPEREDPSIAESRKRPRWKARTYSTLALFRNAVMARIDRHSRGPDQASFRNAGRSYGRQLRTAWA
jgi:hypothetical protein